MLGFTKGLRAVEADSKGWVLADKKHSDEAMQRVRTNGTLLKAMIQSSH